MNNIKIFAMTFAIFTLSACQTLDAMQSDFNEVSHGTFETAQAVTDPTANLLASPCPQVEIVDDLSSLSDFESPKKQNKANLISRVDLRSAESSCKLASKSAVVDLKLFFNGQLGPKGRIKPADKPFFSYPFFVAVTAPSGKIMAKEIFAASLTYAGNENTHVYNEVLRQIIPINSKSEASRYKILIGFQVTPDQLAYNRTHMVPIANAQAAEKK
tara:strand:+ start:167 stop:811 length:645 start_codon:yes stop_codon:yes gene_type:complete